MPTPGHRARRSPADTIIVTPKGNAKITEFGFAAWSGEATSQRAPGPSNSGRTSPRSAPFCSRCSRGGPVRRRRLVPGATGLALLHRAGQPLPPGGSRSDRRQDARGATKGAYDRCGAGVGTAVAAAVLGHEVTDRTPPRGPDASPAFPADLGDRGAGSRRDCRVIWPRAAWAESRASPSVRR